MPPLPPPPPSGSAERTTSPLCWHDPPRRFRLHRKWACPLRAGSTGCHLSSCMRRYSSWPRPHPACSLPGLLTRVPDPMTPACIDNSPRHPRSRCHTNSNRRWDGIGSSTYLMLTYMIYRSGRIVHLQDGARYSASPLILLSLSPCCATGPFPPPPSSSASPLPHPFPSFDAGPAPPSFRRRQRRPI